MMTAVTIAARILQSFEFFRSGAGRWGVLITEKLCQFKFLTIPLFIWGVIRISISSFRLLCSAIARYLNSIGFTGITVGGSDLLAIANTVFPVDEFMGLLVAWASLYAVCASIRFIRAAWAAVPLKAT